MIVRAQRSQDGPAVRQVLTAAFHDTGRVAALAEALQARADRPDAALVAELDGEVIGHVQLSRSWIDAPLRLVEVLVLSPLGVAPNQQRTGVGRALVAAALDRARELAAPAVFLEGDPAYYGRLGWEPASRHGVTPPSARIPEPGLQVVLLPGWQPTTTGVLVYNDTFWAHDCVGLRSAT